MKRTYLRTVGRLSGVLLGGAVMLSGPAALAAVPIQIAQAPAASQSTPAPTAPSSGKQASRVEARISELHSKLQITPDQEDRWKQVADVMRENAQTMDSLIQARRSHATSMNAVDDLKSYGDIAQAHAEGLKKLTPAFEALYASLSDQQKQTADTLFRTHMAHGRATAAPKGKS